MNPSKHSARVVCFDLGGVLVRLRRKYGEAILAAGVPHLEHPALNSQSSRDQRHQLHIAHQLGQLSFSDYVLGHSRAISGLYSPKQVELIHAAVIEVEYPGIAELVDQLVSLPTLRTACLSNTNDAHWSRLSRQGPDAEFPSVARLEVHMASHLLGLAKPDPAIYEAARQRLDVQPSEIVFFDDLAVNVEAANAAGWQAHQVDHEGDPAAQIREVLSRLRLLF